jgi:addiction module RelB/DinJ family antitoxin
MMATALVQVDEALKREADAVLAGFGLTVSDIVQTLLTRITKEKTLPFEVRRDSKCQERQEAVKQTLGSLAIEGLEPDTRFVALMDRYVSGELTLVQVREMLLAESAERYGVERAA